MQTHRIFTEIHTNWPLVFHLKYLQIVRHQRNVYQCNHFWFNSSYRFYYIIEFPISFSFLWLHFTQSFCFNLCVAGNLCYFRDVPTPDASDLLKIFFCILNNERSRSMFQFNLLNLLFPNFTFIFLFIYFYFVVVFASSSLQNIMRRTTLRQWNYCFEWSFCKSYTRGACATLALLK